MTDTAGHAMPSDLKLAGLDPKALHEAERAYMQASSAGAYSVAVSAAISAYLTSLHAPTELSREAQSRDEVVELRAALEPFARADRALGDEPGPYRFETANGHRVLEREDFRRARAALSKSEQNA